MLKDHLTESALSAAQAASLAAAADVLEREAARLREKAARAEHMKGWHAEMWKIPDMLDVVRGYITDGNDEADAIERTATRFSVRSDFLTYYLHQEERQSRSARLWRRDREIMRLAWAGKTNAEIGARLRLTAKSVSRIVSEHLRDRRRFAQPWTPSLQPTIKPKEIAP